MQKIVLDPAMLHENGYPPAFIQNVAGNAASGGYWRVGTGARWIFKTGAATRARLRVYNSLDPYALTGTLPVNNLCYRVNGLDYIAGNLNRGDDWYDLILPGSGTFTPYTSWTKTIEIFVPATTVFGFGNPPSGGFPVEIEFDAPVTPVAPVSTGTNRVIWGDSVPAGGNTIMNPLQGFAGIMKRGTSDAFLEATSPAGVPRWKGAYSAGTLYAVDDVVSYNGSTWRKLTTAAAGTTPTIGTDWRIRGFVGKVTLAAYGARRVLDDCANGTAQTAFATYIASLNPTELLINLGTNDDIFYNSNHAGFTPAQYQAALLGFLNALAGTTASAIPVRCITMFLTNGSGNIEGANSGGYTLDDYRTGMSNAAGATSKSNVSVVNGKTILVAADFNDTFHPSNAGHQKLREALG